MTPDIDPRFPGVTPELLDRYLARVCTPEETRLVEQWLHDDPRHAMRLNAARYAFVYQSTPPVPDPVERIWAVLHERLRQEHALREAASSMRRGAAPGWPRWRMAFALGAIATIVVGFLIGMHERHPSIQATTPGHRYATNAGQRATIRLTDGSRVTIGPKTVLVVATDFGTAQRTVVLDGEAQFEVTTKGPVPFMVRTHTLVTRVLGTTFTVRRYPTDAATRVVTVRGRVSLRDVATNRDAVVLSAGMRGIATDSGRIEVTPNVAIEDYTAWTSGRLIFHETPVPDIVADLGRSYGADIRLADSTLASRALSLTVLSDRQSLSDVLDVLTTLLNAHIIRVGNVITIVPGRSAVRRSIPETHILSKEPQYGL